jgi:hypothetical protein
MQHGIREFRPRQPLDRQLGSETLNRILRELESLRITRVVNGTFKKLPGGTEIVVAPQSGGGTPATTQPWDLVAQVDPDADPENPNPPYLVRVRPGTFNGILPSNWDIEEECAGTGLFYAKAVMATDGEAITGVTIEIDANPPAVQEPVEFGIASRSRIPFWPILRGFCLSSHRRGAYCPADPHLASDQRRPRGRSRRIALRHLLSARAMIAWTIPREKVLTGYTQQTAGDSSSILDTDTYQFSNTFTGGASLSRTYTFAGSSYTSHGATGSTTYFSSSSSAESTVSNRLNDSTNSFSDSFSSSGSTTSSLFSYAAQTSTTETYEYTFAVSLTTATTGSGWSYASSSFFTVSTDTTDNTTSVQTGTVTLDATTESGTVLYGGLADTILQAAGSEVIWYYSSITNWSGITAATQRATSTTRVTIPPLMVLTALPQVTATTNQNSTGVAGNTSHSYSYEDSTYESQYTTTSATTTISTNVLLGDLPNETLTFTPTIARSSAASFVATLFYSDESSVGATDGSTRVLSSATVSHDATPGTFYSGSLLTWDALRTTTTSYSLTTTAPIAHPNADHRIVRNLQQRQRNLY